MHQLPLEIQKLFFQENAFEDVQELHHIQMRGPLLSIHIAVPPISMQPPIVASMNDKLHLLVSQ